MISKTDITAALAGLAIGAGIAGAVIAAQPANVTVPNPYPYSQSAFPCAEDEVLGYAPEFGADRVGCLHIDQLAGVR